MADFNYHDLERCVLGFVLESESWPVFLAWAREHLVTDEAAAWLAAGPDLEELRLEFLRHSPDEYWRAIAEVSSGG